MKTLLFACWWTMLLVAASVLTTGCVPQAQAHRAANADADAGVPDHREPPPEVRPPDDGLRQDALQGWQELAAIRVRIKDVYVSRGYDDDVVRWGNVPTDMWMKVDLEYQFRTKNTQAAYYWWTKSTAANSGVWDDSDRKSRGVNGSAYNREIEQNWKKQGIGRPTEETIYFAAPERGSRYYDLDLVPDHLAPGEKYRFRIPAVMIDWR